MKNKDTQHFKEDAKAILEAVPDLYLILCPKFNIVGASDTYLKATMVKREEVLGQPIFDIFQIIRMIRQQPVSLICASL